MRIVVCGAAGFLGSHLVERLLSLGHYVIGVDNLSTGRLRNLRNIDADDRFYFVRQDIQTIGLTHSIDFSFSLPGYTSNQEPKDPPTADVIFNFACPASPPKYQADPIQTFMTSVMGTKNLIDIALDHNAMLIQASTSEVYGDPNCSIQNESYNGNVNPIGIRSCYDEGKRAAETLIFDNVRVNNLNAKVARIFNTYGPRMDPYDGRVISNVIVQALKGENITLYGTGEQTRSFCYVDDLIDGFIALMNSSKDFHGPVNLGNNREFTINELAINVLKKFDLSSNKITYMPKPADDPMQRCPDLSLAKRVLGWSPKVSLDEGLNKAIAYFAEEIKHV